MNGSKPTWSRARWVRVIVLLFFGQLFLTWVLAERTPRPVREVKEVSQVALLTLPSANEAAHQHPAVAGATLFALVDPRGFSGAAWLRAEPRESPLTDWKEPDFWLAANPDRLGLPFQRFIQTNAPQLTSAAVIPAYESTPVTLPATPPPARSSLAVIGELGARKLLANPAIPLWPLAGTLRPTQVSIAVDASGEVFSAVVEKSSGDDAADEEALRTARQLRFAPSPLRTPKSPIGADLTWGTVVLHWKTTPPAITQPMLP